MTYNVYYQCSSYQLSGLLSCRTMIVPRSKSKLCNPHPQGRLYGERTWWERGGPGKAAIFLESSVHVCTNHTTKQWLQSMHFLKKQKTKKTRQWNIVTFLSSILRARYRNSETLVNCSASFRLSWVSSTGLSTSLNPELQPSAISTTYSQAFPVGPELWTVLCQPSRGRTEPGPISIDLGLISIGLNRLR